MEVHSLARSKVILSGENSVAFGGKAIVCGFNLKNQCFAHRIEGNRCTVTVGNSTAVFSHGDCTMAFAEAKNAMNGDTQTEIRALNRQIPHFWLLAVLGWLTHRKGKSPTFVARISLAAELGSGIGGSATVTALVLRAVAQLAGEWLSEEELYEGCSFGDKIAHGGRGTGTDSAGVVFGGVAEWQGGEVRSVESSALVRFLLCHSGQSKKSSASLEKLSDLAVTDGMRLSEFVKKSTLISNSVLETLKGAPQLERLGKLLNESHALLRETGASTVAIESIVQASLESGALGAKVTGGGGGGFVLVLPNPARYESIRSALELFGNKVLEVTTEDSTSHFREQTAHTF